MPLILGIGTALAGGGLIGHLISGWSTARSLTQQRIDRSEQRIARLEKRSDRMQERLWAAEHVGHRRDRIAHLALDRVEDLEAHLLDRDAALRENDPDGALGWVPTLPSRLADTGWSGRRRAELLELSPPRVSEDDDEDDEEDGGPVRIRDPT